GRRINPNRNAISFAFDVFEMSYDQGGQIGRHFGRGGETHGVFVAGAGCVGRNFLVRDRHHAFVGNGGDVERRFVIGLVKRGEGAAGVGGFKLRGRVLAALVVFSQVKTAHLVVENA